MSTAGERLVQLSGLTAVSASAHLLAITQASGAGATIFASQLTLRSEQQQLTLVQPAARGPRLARQPAAALVVAAKPARVDALTRDSSLTVFTRPLERSIVSAKVTVVSVRTAPKSAVCRRSNKVANTKAGS